jgi:hypothetical protein
MRTVMRIGKKLSLCSVDFRAPLLGGSLQMSPVPCTGTGANAGLAPALIGECLDKLVTSA